MPFPSDVFFVRVSVNLERQPLFKSVVQGCSDSSMWQAASPAGLMKTHMRVSPQSCGVSTSGEKPKKVQPRQVPRGCQGIWSGDHTGKDH